jgi:Protein of unknown function (DUF2997)
MSKIIEVIVSPRGETTVQTKGYAGDSCLKASRALEEALGVSVSENKSAEFFLKQDERSSLKQSN